MSRPLRLDAQCNAPNEVVASFRLPKHLQEVPRSALEKPPAPKRKAIMQHKDAAQFDQTPHALLGPMVRNQSERVVRDSKLQDPRQIGVLLGYHVELFLRNPDRVSATS